jgi:Family of unknown function (DUF6459)
VTAPARPSSTSRPPAPPAPPRLHLVPVEPPQPPLCPEPVRLVLPGVMAPRAAHRPGPRPAPERAPHPDADFGPTLSVRAELPDPRTTGRRLLTVAVEALVGRRPMSQLQPLVTPRLFAALASGRRPRWCTADVTAVLLGPVHVCEPVDGVAEISTVVRRAGRAHAVAARLEGMDGRWRCTALQIG